MVKTTLAALALSAVVFAAAPASAASMSCSGPTMTKVQSTTDAMADGPARWEAYREISLAQTDMLAGNMGGCARHVGKAMKMGMMKPAGM